MWQRQRLDSPQNEGEVVFVLKWVPCFFAGSRF